MYNFLRVPGFGGKIGDEYRKSKAVNRKRSTYIMHSGYRIIQLWCLNTWFFWNKTHILIIIKELKKRVKVLNHYQINTKKDQLLAEFLRTNEKKQTSFLYCLWISLIQRDVSCSVANSCTILSRYNLFAPIGCATFDSFSTSIVS